MSENFLQVRITKKQDWDALFYVCYSASSSAKLCVSEFELKRMFEFHR